MPAAIDVSKFYRSVVIASTGVAITLGFNFPKKLKGKIWRFPKNYLRRHVDTFKLDFNFTINHSR